MHSLVMSPYLHDVFDALYIFNYNGYYSGLTDERQVFR